MKRTKQRPSKTSTRSKGARAQAAKREADRLAKVEAERQRARAKPFVGIMSKIRKGQRLTAAEQTRLDRALRMARRGSKNQWGH
jgi:hypothetical protein